MRDMQAESAPVNGNFENQDETRTTVAAATTTFSKRRYTVCNPRRMRNNVYIFRYGWERKKCGKCDGKRTTTRPRLRHCHCSSYSYFFLVSNCTVLPENFKFETDIYDIWMLRHFIYTVEREYLSHSRWKFQALRISSSLLFIIFLAKQTQTSFPSGEL